MFAYPVTTENGNWSIVKDLEISAFARGRLDATSCELIEEREAVAALSS